MPSNLFSNQQNNQSRMNFSFHDIPLADVPHAPPGQSILMTSRSSHTLHRSHSSASSGVRQRTVENNPIRLESLLPAHDDRTVNRKLRGIHVFMITLGGVLGVGLYLRSGTILYTGGPAAVIIAFTVVGLLAWMVMQCIGEMLALWPISGALKEYVSTFVDHDLGIAAGAAYWCGYSVNFAVDIVAAATIIELWTPPKSIIGIVMFVLVPAFLIFLNSFGVKIYGLIEVISGILKLSGAAIVIIAMILINVGVGSGGYIGVKNYQERSIFQHNKDLASNWFVAFLISLSIATFAFTGVEIATVPAFEARREVITQANRISVRFSATWTAFIVWIIYIWAGMMLTFNVLWNDKRLSQAGEIGQGSPTTYSGFMLSAHLSGIVGLEELFAVVLLITTLTAANTNLYVASRTLFGLTRELHGTQWKWLAFFGRTNSYKVPVRAMFLSCLFLWVPFLYFAPNSSPGAMISNIFGVLSQTGSVCCLIVWVCNVWAYIRFYNCIEYHKNELQEDPYFARVCRDNEKYPWRSHGQPLTMWVALFGCLFILIVADGAYLWDGFKKIEFLQAYLAPMCFIAFWLGLKIYRSSPWQLEDTSNLNVVKDKIQRLNDIMTRATAPDDSEPRGWGNLWGLM